MGFAELKALAARADETVTEGQGAIATAKQEADNALGASREAIETVMTHIRQAKDKYDEAATRYAGISDNDAIQAASASASQGAEALDEALLILDNAMTTVSALIQSASEESDSATTSGSNAIEQSQIYTSRF